MVPAPQARLGGVQKQVEAQELELMESRLQRTAELNGQMDDEDEDSGGYTPSRSQSAALSPAL